MAAGLVAARSSSSAEDDMAKLYSGGQGREKGLIVIVVVWVSGLRAGSIRAARRRFRCASSGCWQVSGPSDLHRGS